jgi:signal transduction histidine kinase
MTRSRAFWGTTGPPICVVAASSATTRRRRTETWSWRESPPERDVIDSELIGRRRDGVLVPVAMSVRRIQDQEGPIHEGILVDLADRKRAEEAAALRSLAELSNAAAHEINNPLTVILGQLELIPHDGRTVVDRIEQGTGGRVPHP